MIMIRSQCKIFVKSLKRSFSNTSRQMSTENPLTYNREQIFPHFSSINPSHVQDAVTTAIEESKASIGLYFYIAIHKNI